MTLYARSDLCAVSVSPDHGGCGATHTRPLIAGAPAKIWGLECPACEDFLRSDKLWSPLVTTIPETTDEKNAREDVEKRGSVEQAQSVATALNQLAKLGDLPAVLGQFMQFMTTGAIAPAAPAAPLVADIVATPEPAVVPQIEAAPVSDVPHTETSDAPAQAPDLDAMTTNDLRELAKQYGVPITRSRDDQIVALKGALG